MICDLPKWWAFLTYDGFTSHINVTEGLENVAEERIRVGKEEAGTSGFNQSYDKPQAKQDKAQTRQLLELARHKVHGRITQWQLIMVISTAIKKFLLKSGYIPLLMLTLILITAWRFTTVSKIFRQLLRQERHHILETMRIYTMMPCYLFGKICLYLLEER